MSEHHLYQILPNHSPFLQARLAVQVFGCAVLRQIMAQGLAQGVAALNPHQSRSSSVLSSALRPLKMKMLMICTRSTEVGDRQQQQQQGI
jgi:hypothetical protein